MYQILIIESNIVYKYFENKATIIILNLQKGLERQRTKPQTPVTHRLEVSPFQDGCSAIRAAEAGIAPVQNHTRILSENC